MRTVIYILIILFLYSCRNNEEKFISATIKYTNRLYKLDSTIIKNDKDLKIIKGAITSLKPEIAVFGNFYTIIIHENNGYAHEYVCNGYVFRDSINSYYIPKGEIRDSYLSIIKKYVPDIIIDKMESEH